MSKGPDRPGLDRDIAPGPSTIPFHDFGAARGLVVAGAGDGFRPAQMQGLKGLGTSG